MREDEMLQLLQLLMRSLMSDDRIASLYADKTASILRGDRLKMICNDFLVVKVNCSTSASNIIISI